MLRVLGQNLGRMQTRLMDQIGHGDEWPHIFMRGRRVHDDEAATCAIDAQIASEAGVAGGGAQRLCAQPHRVDKWRQPGFKGGLAFAAFPGDFGSGRGRGLGHGAVAVVGVESGNIRVIITRVQPYPHG